MSNKIEVGILGATGMVGQQFINFLQGHPWFTVAWLGASERSAGKKYSEATTWRLDGEMPDSVRNLIVNDSKPGAAPQLMFSAMDASVATEIERAFAEAGHYIVSNSRNHRMEPDVPLLVPEVNPDHLRILPTQRANRGWKGGIVTNPNCSTVVLSMGLAPLKPFGIKKVLVTTMQAISGSGYPGHSAFDMTANVFPFIKNEEPKMESEPQKILGGCTGDRLTDHPMVVSAACNRVEVLDGHTETVAVSLSKKVTEADLIEAFNTFRGLPQERELPSAPPRPVIYMTQPDRPQPRRDVNRDNGMTVFLGRLRECPVLDWKFLAMGHNTVRGAAGAAVLNAELMKSEGLFDQ
jgi:aspartate-semialdehyde dehydrogenase